MSIIINEQKMISDNMFEYEGRLKSPMARYMDVTPVFVTYFHIDVEHSSVDAGYADVQNIIGTKSPLRFKKIENFPIYGIDQILPQLQNAEQGLDSSYEDEATIVAGTIKPLQNDFFIIPQLNNEHFLFRVIDVNYGSSVNDNLYKVSYQFEYNDENKGHQLKEQVVEEYNCIIDNIGTDHCAIIEKSHLEDINRVEKIYSDMANTYKSIFYNERHNVFLGEMGPNQFLYDPLQTEFINKHSLFNKKNNLEVLILNDEIFDTKRKIKYEKSIYRFFERQDVRLISTFDYVTYPGITKEESSFARWVEKNIYVLDLPVNNNLPDIQHIFSKEYETSIKMNMPQQHSWAKIMQSYARGEDIPLRNIPDSLNEDILFRLDANLEAFFFAPILLYIMKNLLAKEYAREKSEDIFK